MVQLQMPIEYAQELLLLVKTARTAKAKTKIDAEQILIELRQLDDEKLRSFEEELENQI